ncbi:MAG: hypothetical protein IT546_11145 [Caulobacteraceae bacterium]|nr:hypothetical protein [Caulobacteraceae bacterium]
MAQGIAKQLIYKKQSGLGTPATGSGGQLLRRRTANFTLARDTYQNDEIASHQQSTGATAGIRRVTGRLSGLLSGATYADFFAAALRKAWAATSNLTGLSVTIAASGSDYTVTRGSGDFLTGGIKVGDVVRLAAAGLDPANAGKNLLVLGVTATVLTVRPLNGSAMVAEGPISTTTLSVPGKKVWVPTSGHTDDWFTFEEFYSDLTKSELNTDVKTGQIQIGMPATGNVTVDIDFIGLNRTLNNSQQLTSPTAETSTDVATAVNGLVAVGGSVTRITGAQVTINGGVNAGEAEVGANTIADVQRGRIQVTGQVTAKVTSTTLQALYDDQTPTSLILAAAADGTADADFVTLVMSKLKLFGDAADDGEKELIRTFPFTAEINGDGGANLANHQTILSIQDSTLS